MSKRRTTRNSASTPPPLLGQTKLRRPKKQALPRPRSTLTDISNRGEGDGDGDWDPCCSTSKAAGVGPTFGYEGNGDWDPRRSASKAAGAGPTFGHGEDGDGDGDGDRDRDRDWPRRSTSKAAGAGPTFGHGEDGDLRCSTSKATRTNPTFIDLSSGRDLDNMVAADDTVNSEDVENRVTITPSKDIDQLSRAMRSMCALRFFADRSSETSSMIVDSIFKKLMPRADPTIGEGDLIYSTGLNAFNNMRYQFMSTIKTAAESYKIGHIAEIEDNGQVDIPNAREIKMAIGSDIVDRAFKSSLKHADTAFLNSSPRNGSCTVKTMLQNVLAHAVHAALLHKYNMKFVKEKELREFIYSLDKLTPSNRFTAPPRKSSPRLERKRKRDGCECGPHSSPLKIELVLSDGEVEEVSIYPKKRD